MVIAFDFDGIINKSAYFSVLYEEEYGVSRSELQEFFKTDFDPCAIGKAAIEQVLPPYLKKWKWGGSVEDFLDYWFKSDILLDTELLALVRRLKLQGAYVVLVSQQEKNRRDYIWEQLGLQAIFDKFYCTCDIGYLKSDPAFYHKMVENLIRRSIISSKKELLFFDDSVNFITAAKEAGLESYHVEQNETIFEILKKKYNYDWPIEK